MSDALNTAAREPAGSASPVGVASRMAAPRRKCACGASTLPIGESCEQCQSNRLQRKLTVGTSNDTLELEADRVAAQVMSSRPHDQVAHAPVSIQRAASGGSSVASAVPASVDQQLKRSGTTLDPGLRRNMEQRFGHDFSRVRVHADAQAAGSARDINAKAYTAGDHIVFGASRYAPETSAGRQLLAHELTHVIQQSGRSPVVQRDIEDLQRAKRELEDFRQTAQRRHEETSPRKLTIEESTAASMVFGNMLDTSEVVISEGGLFTLGGYARTLPNRIHFPNGSFARPDFLGYLIHELTHVWQYQRGANIPGMAWEAIVGIYDYGGDEGLRKAWADGKAFDEFTTEQQGDILENYFKRRIRDGDLSAFQPFVDQVRTGKEKVHRYKTVEPLEVGTLDLPKLQRESKARDEAEIVRQLRRPMEADDKRAGERANRVVELFRRQTFWRTEYWDRFVNRRPGDELVSLLYSRVSRGTRKRVFEVLGIDIAKAGIKP